MSEPLVECVPNFSEGRDIAVIHALVEAMHLPGVLLLDCRMDPEGNRTAVTIAGPPAAVCEAAVRAVGVAVERIDLTRQRGAHPRIGAADVIPFAPLRDAPLALCAVLAREAAEALWDRYKVPSYLYEAAASRPDRVLLEEVRRGQFEGLREAVLRDAGRRPDVGGPGLHPTAGASAVGARRVLIEYRVALEPAEIGTARAIARAVRGELGGVRAAGVTVDGRACIDLQIADFRQMSVGAVHAALLDAAASRRVRTGAGRILGLIPEDAYEQGSDWAAGLEEFDPERNILERVLERVLERRQRDPQLWQDVL